MKKTMKGFTLIECIIAMAIMGIASMLMVQVYGTVALMNRDNRKMNVSLEVQMEYAENQLAEEGGDVKIGRYANYTPVTSEPTSPTAPPKDTNGGTKSGTLTDGIKFDMKDATKKAKFDNPDKSSEIDLYVIGTNNGSSENPNYDSNTVRYKFILPRNYDEHKGEAKEGTGT